MDKTTLIKLRKQSFFSRSLIAEPHNTHVEVAAKAVNKQGKIAVWVPGKTRGK